MPDMISKYRMVRLSVYPSPDGQTCRWALLAITVRKGVPHTNVIADGSMITPYGMNTELGIWETLQALSSAETRG